MGVAGLWEVLRPAGQVRSLTELAVEDGFNANPSHQRGFRIGVDASIWFFHAAYGKEGENPELRTLFFRCCRLLQTPMLPLFVFDGPNRPAVKRGKRVGGNAHWLTQGMRNIIDAFGFEWWVAPGEAEAELAYLNRIGVIDAVLSDDVDNFLFGATMVIRNPSNTLSGNRAHPVKNSKGKDDGNHVVTYTADAILSDPSVALSRSGTILIGLLSGGDYIPAGLPGCGQKFATGLARAGFGDSLVKAVKGLKGTRLDAFLDQWKQDIRNELKTNKSGLLPSKKPSLAASLPDDFPSLPVLMSYADPLTSENTPQKGKPKTPLGVWRNDPDPMRIASLCELYFEWGVKEIIVHRFRTVLWPGIVCRAVRRSVVDQDTRRHPQSNGAQCYYGSGGDDDNASPSSPTKRISFTLSALTLSSPSKKSSTATTASDPGGSESFSLSSLVPLASCASPSSFRSASPSSPYSAQSPLLQEVLSQRTHVSTDSTLEYRVLVDPTALVLRAESGVKGIRPPLVGGLFGTDPEDEGADEGSDADADESESDGAIGRLETAAGATARSSTKKRKARRGDPMMPLRLWVPACMVRAAAPALVEAYEEKVRVREEKKARCGARGGRSGRVRAVTVTVRDVDGDGESAPGPSSSKTVGEPKARTKVVRVGGGGRRRKPGQTSEAQDDAYEFIDLSAGESPCSSDGEGVEENTKGKAKTRARVGQTNPAKQTTKVGRKTGRAAMTKSKPPTSRSSVITAPTLAPVALRRVYEEEEEDSADAAVPPPLPKSSRPLDLLRAKSNPSTAVSDPTSKHRSSTTSIQRYEEEESSSSSSPRPSGSKPSASSLPCRPAAVALTRGARKKPLFVDVSDTDSDIEVSDVHGDVSMSVGIGETSILAPAKGRVIDLTTKGGTARLKGTPMLMPIASHPPVCPISAPIDADMIGSMGTSRTPSKLAHILLPQSALQNQEEEESEEDELPTFRHGSAGSKANKGPTIARPPPRPFPIQLSLDSPVSRASRNECKHDDNDDDDDVDMVEIVDVFTTPRRPSPPRSPTLSPSPVKSSPDHAMAGPSEFVKSKQLDGFPISPTESKFRADTEPYSRIKQPRRLSSDHDTQVSVEERNDVLKSPRKSAEHTSPKHPRASPIPLALSCPASRAKDLAPWTGDREGRDVSDDHQSKPDGIGRKPRLSDTSAIYISSESEDEGKATIGIGDDRSGGRTGVSNADLDADEWADTGMILSAPPSPARSPRPLAIDRMPAAPSTEAALAVPARASKFKPASAPASKQLAGARSAERRASDRATSVEIGASRAVQRAPLLAARARRNKGRDDVIDLTSD